MSLTVEKCLQAWTNSLRQMNARADIVFFGDSLTYYGDFSSVFPDKVVCNLGLRGDTIQGMADRVEQVKMLNPKVVYLMAGINDVTSLDIESFENHYECLIKCIFENLPLSRLVIQSILPVDDKAFQISCNNNQIRTCNNAIKNVSRKYGLTYLDLYSIYECNLLERRVKTKDGIHLKEEEYNVWYENLLHNYNLIVE